MTDLTRIEGTGPPTGDVPSSSVGLPTGAIHPSPQIEPVKRKKTTAQRKREQKKQHDGGSADPQEVETPEIVMPVSSKMTEAKTFRLPELQVSEPELPVTPVEEPAPDHAGWVADPDIEEPVEAAPVVQAPDEDAPATEPAVSAPAKGDLPVIDVAMDIAADITTNIASDGDTPPDKEVSPKPELESPEPEQTSELAEVPEPDILVKRTLYDAMHGLTLKTDLSNCLIPLLDSIGWIGHPRHVAEAIPHFIDNLDITSFRNIMANLRFESWPINISLRKIDQRLMPCIFLPNKGPALVVKKIEGKVIYVFNGETLEHEEISGKRMTGTAYVFKKLDADIAQAIKSKLGWFRAVIERFRGLTYQVLILTLILNLLALSTPLFVMAVYDKVIASRSMETLAFFAVGVTLALFCDMVLRGIRARILAFIGARLDNIVGNAVFQRILLLPAALTERSTVGSQVARIKDFENVREFFTGQIAMTFIELPFAIIFVIVIAILGGPVAFVPLVMVVLFAILGLVMMPLIQQSVTKAGRGASRRQELVVETLSSMRTVKASGSEDTWLERYREDSALASLNSFYTSLYGSLVQTISGVMMTAAGMATVAFGVFRVLDGNMTIGALVACMMLVWRVLGPLQMTFVSLARLTQVKSSITQINGLMGMRVEREPDKTVLPLPRLSGAVSFDRVSMRYSADTDPALVGVTFDVEPGEVVCIIGGNGSGKSTLLKIIAGLYFQQAGSVRIDDQDLRQLDLIEVRHAISYVPQIIQFFYGTIAQNMRLTRPTASDEDLQWAAQEAGVLKEILDMEQGSGKWKRSGFGIRIGDASAASMPTSFMQRLNLARGYLKQSPIMLFDEPGNGLDYEGDQTFMKKIDRLRGGTTVFIVTHRPSHLKLADKIVWMEGGHLKVYGPAADVLKQIPKNFL